MGDLGTVRNRISEAGRFGYGVQMKSGEILCRRGVPAASGEFGGMAASERWATVSNGSTRCKSFIGARFSGPAAGSKGFVEGADFFIHVAGRK